MRRSMQNLAKEAPRPFALRCREEALGRRYLDDLTGVHENYAIGDLSSEAHLMSNDHPRPVDHDIALLMFLELVEATNQRRFSGARRTTDDYPLAPRYREINISQRLEATKELVHVAHRDDLTTDFMVRSGNFGFCGHG